jgi:signal transduction histidine kinase
VRTASPLRSRLVVGSILWAIGLMAVSNVVILGLVLHRYPGWTVHFGAMSVAGIGLLVGGLLQLRSILAPFRQLQSRLTAVRDGRELRLEGAYPAEVEPLVNDLNALLDHRAKVTERAISKAGDLAHGLKTPLAVLGQEAERLTAAGHYEPAAIIGAQVERMRRQIDYHLAHARAAASGSALGASCAVQPSAEGLVRTLERLYVEKGISIRPAIPSSLCVRVQREDLDEMVGNLLDNACKWAKSRVSIEASEEKGNVAIVVDDDGPGLAPELREKVLQRGVRADEAAPGSGFGLAIVRDLAELHSGSISLEASPKGGVRARLSLPSCATPPDR